MLENLPMHQFIIGFCVAVAVAAGICYLGDKIIIRVANKRRLQRLKRESDEKRAEAYRRAQRESEAIIEERKNRALAASPVSPLPRLKKVSPPNAAVPAAGTWPLDGDFLGKEGS